jgi:PAS domain S-box-containing protein
MNPLKNVVNILIALIVFACLLLIHRVYAYYHPNVFSNIADLIIGILIGGLFVAAIYLGIVSISKNAARRIKNEYRIRLADAQYKKLMEDSGISTITIDKNGIIRFVSKNIGRLTGYSAGEVVGTDVLKAVPSDYRPLIRDLIRSIGERNEYDETFQLQLHTKQRIDKWISMRTYPLRGNNNYVNELLLMIWDIGKEKQMQEELRNLEELQKKQQEQARLSQEVFLANVSHEIRTPLNGIVGMGNLLLSTPLNEEQKEYLESIQESAKNLLAIINDLLDFSKIKSGKFHLEITDFKPREVIKKTLYPLLIRANEKGLTLNCLIDTSVPEAIIGDSLRFQQVLINLIANAIKFTEHGSVEIKVYPVSFKDDTVLMGIDVTDTGIGIAEDKIAHIFESYVQSDTNISRIYGGTGLGLAIVKQLAEMQNGNVSAKSTIGKGSTFSLQIPYKVSEASHEFALPGINDNEQHTREILKNIKVLVVEDNIINQKVVQQTLIKQNAQVKVAANGRNALDKMREEDFDIILMDLQMPEMDGYETTTYIRTVMKSDVPIVAMTADALKGESDKCFEVGMNNYISKPFDPGDLYRIILQLTKAKV